MTLPPDTTAPIPTVWPTRAAEPIDLAPFSEGVPIAAPTRSRFAALASACEWVFGAACLVLGLAILTAVPVGQFLVLGYLLEVEGRVARSGRLRDGFPGVRTAARLGRIALDVTLCWLPLWLVASTAAAAEVIDPGGPAARGWAAALTGLSVLFVLHVVAACLRGGRLRYFAWPFNLVWLARRVFRGGLYREARDGVWAAAVSLRVPSLFWLGFRGYVGAFAWLFLPAVFLAQGHRLPGVGVLGAMMLSVVALYLPFLQARFARDHRLRALLAVRSVRADFRRAPWAFAAGLWAQLLGAVPLYVLKIEAIPRDLIFLEGLVFVAVMLPARWLVGWAAARGATERPERHWASRWSARLLMLPAVAVYVFGVFASPHVGWRGVASLFEQHAFLPPVPFASVEG